MESQGWGRLLAHVRLRLGVGSDGGEGAAVDDVLGAGDRGGAR